MKPTISIILPTYNRCYILWRAIQSVLNQTHRNWELLIIDDGSTDQTARCVSYFRDSRIRYFFQENAGPSAARNFGVTQAQSDLIGYLDSDNYYHPRFIEIMTHALLQKKSKVFAFCAKNSTKFELRKKNAADGFDLLPVSYSIDHTLNFSPERVFKMEVGADTNTFIHWNYVWDTIGGWDESCHWLEDWDFNARVALHYPTGVLRVKQALVEYEQVHGEWADGLCAKAREHSDEEIKARQYLYEKYKDEPLFRENTLLLPGNLRLKKVRAKTEKK